MPSARVKFAEMKNPRGERFLFCIQFGEWVIFRRHKYHMPPSPSPKSVDESVQTHTVVFADDAVMTRQSLVIALPILFPSCVVVGQASDGDEALELCLRLKPSVLVSDLRLPKRNGLALITQLRTMLPGTGVMIHTGCENAVMLAVTCDAHPAGLIHSDDGVAGLRKAFEAARAGERYVSKAVMDRITRPGVKRSSLTPMEVTVLAMVAEGQLSKEIAVRLGMGERTVGSHRESINKKLGTRDHGALVKWAMRNGLME